jgi:putative Holliday junction resolvase
VTAAILALDIGEKRIGVAIARAGLTIAQTYTTLSNDDTTVPTLKQIFSTEGIETLVVGLPRNLSGDDTAQTRSVREFAAQLQRDLGCDIEFQDEALTSHTAEELLKQSGKPYAKPDIDAMAAALILQDYLEEHRK